MVKVSNMNEGTLSTYNVALNNFENFCMERFGEADIVEKLKGNSDNEILDFLQEWINWNQHLAPVTVLNLFSRVKKYLHHRGIKLHPQDIKEELVFRRTIQEELYPITVEDINKIISKMRKKQMIQFVCQSSSLMRIGELVQLRKKHLILGGKNIIVKLPPTITKFSKARTTFFSKEASKLLYSIINKMGDNDLVFGSNENHRHAEINAEQILRRILDKVDLDMKIESTGRYKINTHSFRAFGIGKLARHDVNFSKKLSGQKGYLLQYDRMNDEEKLELYQKFEYDLIINTTEKLKVENDKLKGEKEVWKNEEADRNKKYHEILKAEIIKELSDSNTKILPLNEEIKRNEMRSNRIKKEIWKD